MQEEQDAILNTRFEEIYSLFLGSIQDYTIKKLFVEDLFVAEGMLEIFLLRAIPLFYNCTKDISDVDLVKKEFLCKLTLQEKTIISNLMLLSWLDWRINNISQMDMSLSDNDFKHFAEEKNLKEKSGYAERYREKVYQDMVQYGLQNTPFDRWAVGDYGI